MGAMQIHLQRDESRRSVNDTITRHKAWVGSLSAGQFVLASIAWMVQKDPRLAARLLHRFLTRTHFALQLSSHEIAARCSGTRSKRCSIQRMARRVGHRNHSHLARHLRSRRIISYGQTSFKAFKAIGVFIANLQRSQ